MCPANMLTTMMVS